MTTCAYVGNELDTFAHAVNWKRYFGRLLAPHEIRQGREKAFQEM